MQVVTPGRVKESTEKSLKLFRIWVASLDMSFNLTGGYALASRDAIKYVFCSIYHFFHSEF